MSAPTRPPGDLLSDLTPPQQAAVTHGEGPLLILAGAGSGKTRVITRRVAYLLQSGVRPGNILAITFTNKAAGEMRSRVEQLVPGNRVWVSTFHSLGARLLRQYADRLDLDKNFTIYDTDDRAKLVKDALAAAGIDDVKFTPDRLAGAIGKAKNQLLTPKLYARERPGLFHPDGRQGVRLLREEAPPANAMDFDDLLYIPAMALRHNEEFRADLDSRFKYVLIDEYQDTNSAQYEIVRRLCDQPPEHLCRRRPRPIDLQVARVGHSRISSTSSATSRTRRSSPWSRTTAVPRRFWPRRARSSTDNTSGRRRPSSPSNPQGDPVRVITFDNGLDEAEGVVTRIKAAVKPAGGSTATTRSSCGSTPSPGRSNRRSSSTASRSRS